MVPKVPPGLLKTETETEIHQELEQKSTVFFHTANFV